MATSDFHVDTMMIFEGQSYLVSTIVAKLRHTEAAVAGRDTAGASARRGRVQLVSNVGDGCVAIFDLMIVAQAAETALSRCVIRCMAPFIDEIRAQCMSFDLGMSFATDGDSSAASALTTGIIDYGTSRRCHILHAPGRDGFHVLMRCSANCAADLTSLPPRSNFELRCGDHSTNVLVYDVLKEYPGLADSDLVNKAAAFVAPIGEVPMEVCIPLIGTQPLEECSHAESSEGTPLADASVGAKSAGGEQIPSSTLGIQLAECARMVRTDACISQLKQALAQADELDVSGPILQPAAAAPNRISATDALCSIFLGCPDAAKVVFALARARRKSLGARGGRQSCEALLSEYLAADVHRDTSWIGKLILREADHVYVQRDDNGSAIPLSVAGVQRTDDFDVVGVRRRIERRMRHGSLAATHLKNTKYGRGTEILGDVDTAAMYIHLQQRGTQVHEGAEHMLRTGSHRESDTAFGAAETIQLVAVLIQLALQSVFVIASELVVHDEQAGVAGTIDGVLARVDSNGYVSQLGILDFKTSESIELSSRRSCGTFGNEAVLSASSKYRSIGLQPGGYSLLLARHTQLDVSMGLAVCLGQRVVSSSRQWCQLERYSSKTGKSSIVSVNHQGRVKVGSAEIEVRGMDIIRPKVARSTTSSSASTPPILETMESEYHTTSHPSIFVRGHAWHQHYGAAWFAISVSGRQGCHQARPIETVRIDRRALDDMTAWRARRALDDMTAWRASLSRRPESIWVMKRSDSLVFSDALHFENYSDAFCELMQTITLRRERVKKVMQTYLQRSQILDVLSCKDSLAAIALRQHRKTIDHNLAVGNRLIQERIDETDAELALLVQATGKKAAFEPDTRTAACETSGADEVESDDGEQSEDEANDQDWNEDESTTQEDTLGGAQALEDMVATDSDSVTEGAQTIADLSDSSPALEAPRGYDAILRTVGAKSVSTAVRTALDSVKVLSRRFAQPGDAPTIASVEGIAAGNQADVQAVRNVTRKLLSGATQVSSLQQAKKALSYQCSRSLRTIQLMSAGLMGIWTENWKKINGMGANGLRSAASGSGESTPSQEPNDRKCSGPTPFELLSGQVHVGVVPFCLQLQELLDVFTMCTEMHYGGNHSLCGLIRGSHFGSMSCKQRSRFTPFRPHSAGGHIPRTLSKRVVAEFEKIGSRMEAAQSSQVLCKGGAGLLIMSLLSSTSTIEGSNKTLLKYSVKGRQNRRGQTLLHGLAVLDTMDPAWRSYGEPFVVNFLCNWDPKAAGGGSRPTRTIRPPNDLSRIAALWQARRPLMGSKRSRQPLALISKLRRHAMSRQLRQSILRDLADCYKLHGPGGYAAPISRAIEANDGDFSSDLDSTTIPESGPMDISTGLGGTHADGSQANLYWPMEVVAMLAAHVGRAAHARLHSHSRSAVPTADGIIPMADGDASLCDKELQQLGMLDSLCDQAVRPRDVGIGGATVGESTAKKSIEPTHGCVPADGNKSGSRKGKRTRAYPVMVPGSPSALQLRKGAPAFTFMAGRSRAGRTRVHSSKLRGLS